MTTTSSLLARLGTKYNALAKQAILVLVDSFEALERQVALSPSITGDQWTLYQGRSDEVVPKGVSRDPADWGMTCIYRFNREWPSVLLPRFVELRSELVAQVARLGLESKIRLVPYYKVGADYLIQPKPPYDGGYTTSRFAEFVSDAECKPPPGFVLSHAELLDALIEKQDMIDAGRSSHTELVRTVLHNSLIRPWSELFWDDERDVPWVLYRPCVERYALESWSR